MVGALAVFDGPAHADEIANPPHACEPNCKDRVSTHAGDQPWAHGAQSEIMEIARGNRQAQHPAALSPDEDDAAGAPFDHGFLASTLRSAIVLKSKRYALG